MLLALLIIFTMLESLSLALGQFNDWTSVTPRLENVAPSSTIHLEDILVDRKDCQANRQQSGYTRQKTP